MIQLVEGETLTIASHYSTTSTIASHAMVRTIVTVLTGCAAVASAFVPSTKPSLGAPVRSRRGTHTRWWWLWWP